MVLEEKEGYQKCSKTESPPFLHQLKTELTEITLCYWSWIFDVLRREKNPVRMSGNFSTERRRTAKIWAVSLSSFWN